MLEHRVKSQGKRKDGTGKGADIDVLAGSPKRTPSSPASSHILQGIQLPLELWWIVFESLLGDVEHDPAATRGLAAAAAVCRGFQRGAKAALYRRVSIGPNIRQVHTFAQTVIRNAQHAAAVKFLRIEIPDLDAPLRPLFESISRLCTPLPRCPGAQRVSPDTPDCLRDLLCELLQKTVNLVELDFVALDDFPYALHGATFQLHTLRTTHAGLELLHNEENRVTPISHGQLHAPPPPLDTLQVLTLNMRGVEYRAQALQVSFHRYHITHLALDFAPTRSVARDLLPLLCDTLVSFKMVLARLTSELSPPQRLALGFRTDAHLWPTQILGDTVLPGLRYLELCETDYNYSLVSAPHSYCLSFRGTFPHAPPHHRPI